MGLAVVTVVLTAVIRRVSSSAADISGWKILLPPCWSVIVVSLSSLRLKVLLDLVTPGCARPRPDPERTAALPVAGGARTRERLTRFSPSPGRRYPVCVSCVWIPRKQRGICGRRHSRCVLVDRSDLGVVWGLVFVVVIVAACNCVARSIPERGRPILGRQRLSQIEAFRWRGRSLSRLSWRRRVFLAPRLFSMV